MSKKLSIKIYTDISIFENIATWAYWIESERFLICKSGVFSKDCQSVFAEIECIVMALKELLDQKELLVKNITIYTDCTGAIDHLNRTGKSKKLKEGKNIAWQVEQKYNLELSYELVGKNLGIEEHEWCHNTARKLINKLINQ